MKSLLFLAAIALARPISQSGPVPMLKEGLWSVHTVSTDTPGTEKTEATYTLCRNHAFDQAIQALAKTQKGCTTVHESMAGDTYSAETQCVVGTTTISSKGTTTFQGDASTHSETHATYSPAFSGKTATTLIMDQKYMGACPAGAKPGDRTYPDGRVVHSRNGG